MKIATDISKEGPTYLTKRAEEFRTARELLESGLFRKDSRTGNISIVIVIEKNEEGGEEEEIKESPCPPKKGVARTKSKKGMVKVKQEGELKVKKEKEPRVKKESGIKQELFTPVRKRGISQLSSPDGQIVEKDFDETDELLYSFSE